jgi:hypothetical protein
MNLNGHGVGTSHIFLNLNMPGSGADGILADGSGFQENTNYV